MVNYTYLAKKHIYNKDRCIKSLMDREGCDKDTAIKIHEINLKVKGIKKLNKEYKKDDEYIKLYNEKLNLLNIDPVKYIQSLNVKRIMKTKKCSEEIAKKYLNLTDKINAEPRSSKLYQYYWKQRKLIFIKEKIQPPQINSTKLQQNNETKNNEKSN